VKIVGMLVAFAVASVAVAQSPPEPRATPKVDADVLKHFGSLPAPGNIHDVLACAGANELVWTETVRKDPYSREGSEAKRKAGWYSAVALHVFAVESKAVLDAIEAAKKPSARAAALETARSCRAAPQNWRE